MKNSPRKFCKGQSLIEIALVLPLFAFFWLTLIAALIDGLGLIIWNSQVEKYLICAKDHNQQRTCLRQLLETEKKINWIQVHETKTGHLHNAPHLTLKLSGLLIKNYENKKYLDLATWRQ